TGHDDVTCRIDLHIVRTIFTLTAEISTEQALSVFIKFYKKAIHATCIRILVSTFCGNAVAAAGKSSGINISFLIISNSKHPFPVGTAIVGAPEQVTLRRKFSYEAIM